MTKVKSAKIRNNKPSAKPAENPRGEYAAAWRQLENVRFTLLWVTVLGTFVAGSFGLFFVVGFAPVKTAVVAAMVWIAFAVWSVVRYLRWPCPKCHKVWQGKANGSGVSFIPHESCPHCGLKAKA